MEKELKIIPEQSKSQEKEIHDFEYDYTREDSPISQLYRMIKEQKLEEADAVVWLEGDNDDRVAKCVELIQRNFAPKIILSGEHDDPNYGSIPGSVMKKEFINAGIREERIEMDDSQNTKDQAVNVMNLSKENNWNKVIIVASPYHQIRAFLTFLAQLKKEKMEEQFKIINAPADLNWFHEAGGRQERDAVELLETEEIPRMIKYSEKGDVAMPSEGVEYLKYWQGRDSFKKEK